jgi:hypothetical protein
MSGGPPQASGETIESLIERLSQVADPQTLAIAQGLVRAVLDLHQAGLARILELVPLAQAEAIVGDGVVAKLLLLHGLHPDSIETRARAALERLSPTGWRIELVDARDGFVRVALSRVGDAKRAAMGDRVRALIEQAIDEAAPEAAGLEISGGSGDDADATFIPIERLRIRGPVAGDGLP